MPQILSSEISTTMQNVYTPLPLNVHFVFCAIATLIYLLQYARKGSAHYLLVMLAIDLTFVTQICTASAVMTCLFLAEVVLLVMAGVISHKYNKRLKAQNESKNVPAEGDDTDFED